MRIFMALQTYTFLIAATLYFASVAVGQDLVTVTDTFYTFKKG